MKVHELIIHPDYFKATSNGSRRFEIVKKDKNFKLGDQLLLREGTFDGLTGRYCLTKVTYIQNSYTSLLSGYTVISYMLLNVFNF